MTERELPGFDAALREQGYTVILAIGIKETDNDYRLKVAAVPMLKSLKPDMYYTLLDTVMKALERLYDTPMDDLELQS